MTAKLFWTTTTILRLIGFSNALTEIFGKSWSWARIVGSGRVCCRRDRDGVAMGQPGFCWRGESGELRRGFGARVMGNSHGAGPMRRGVDCAGVFREFFMGAVVRGWRGV
jgi:hypothetical protein